MITDRPGMGGGTGSNNGATSESGMSGQGGESKVNQLGHMAQEKLSGAASYLKDRGVSGIRADVTDFAHRNPIGAVAISLGIGYVLGRLMTRR